MTDDPYDLQRFVNGQEPVYDAVLRELAAGRKRTHWIWFIFPQLRALGSSSTAKYYGIGTLAEAKAYLQHPILGPRLVECVDRVLAVRGRSLYEILGTPDDMKFRSSMTLFARATPNSESVFERALERYCEGAFDVRTLALLDSERPDRA